MKIDYRSNIWKAAIIRSFNSFMLSIPIITIFLMRNGLSLSEIFTLQSIFSLAAIILEIPTGYFSDRFSRKSAIIIGATLASAGFAIYSVSDCFYGFLCAELVLAIGSSFLSGADGALLFDSLRAEGLEVRYSRELGRILSLSLASEGVACIIGGYIGSYEFRWTFYGSVFTELLVIPFALSIKEPPREKLEKEKRGTKEAICLIVKYLRENDAARLTTLYAGIASASTWSVFWFTQPYLESIEMPTDLFGWIFTGLMMISSLTSRQAHQIEMKIGSRIAIALLTFLPAIGSFLLISSRYSWSWVFIALFNMTRGMNPIFTEKYIVNSAPPAYRATVLSAKNMINRMMLVITGLAIGAISRSGDLDTTMAIMGASFFLIGSLLLSRMAHRRVI